MFNEIRMTQKHKYYIIHFKGEPSFDNMSYQKVKYQQLIMLETQADGKRKKKDKVLYIFFHVQKYAYVGMCMHVHVCVCALKWGLFGNGKDQ